MKYMVVQRRVLLNIYDNWLEVEDYRFRKVQQFKYLGIILTQQNDNSKGKKFKLVINITLG